MSEEYNIDRRYNPEGNQNYDIKSIWEHHIEIARLLTCGMRAIDIARELGITPETVSNVRNNPIFKEQLAALMLKRDANTIDIAKRIQKIAPKALDLMEKTMEDELQREETSQVGARVALGLLEHASPKNSTTTHKVSGHVTHSDIKSIRDRARNSGMVVEEGEFKEVEEVK